MAHAVAVPPPPVTADELLRMPDDGVRRELLDGELREMTPAGAEHGAIAAAVLVSLGHHVRTHGLGRVFAAETGFKLGGNPDTVLAPDAAFVSRERIGPTVGKGYRTGAPDLVVEVLSPADSIKETEAKVSRWLAAGCRMAVVVNPARRAASVYRPLSDVVLVTGDEEIDGGDVVSGWRLPLRELFD